MPVACEGSLLTYLSQVPDPRGRKGRRHPLSAMLTAVVCGLLCGNRGYTSLVDGMCERIRAELDADATVVATGGLSGLIGPLSSAITHVEPWLTLHGLRLIFEKNVDA